MLKRKSFFQLLSKDIITTLLQEQFYTTLWVNVHYSKIKDTF